MCPQRYEQWGSAPVQKWKMMGAHGIVEGHLSTGVSVEWAEYRKIVDRCKGSTDCARRYANEADRHVARATSLRAWVERYESRWRSSEILRKGSAISRGGATITPTIALCYSKISVPVRTADYIESLKRNCSKTCCDEKRFRKFILWRTCNGVRLRGNGGQNDQNLQFKCRCNDYRWHLRKNGTQSSQIMQPEEWCYGSMWCSRLKSRHNVQHLQPTVGATLASGIRWRRAYVEKDRLQYPSRTTQFGTGKRASR